jgi:hypothetical protein
MRAIFSSERLAISRWAACALFPWLISGCGAGALNQAVVASDCKPGDKGCEAAIVTAPLAVGATLDPRIAIELPGSTVPSIHLESAAPDILFVEGDHVRARAAGMAALLFVTDDGTVTDFLHVFVKEPTRIALDRLAADGTVEPATMGVDLLTGELMRLRATALGDGQPLDGALPVEWSVTPPSVAEVFSDGQADKRRILAKAPGAATISVKSGKLESKLDIVVHARPNGSLGAEVSR